MQRPGIKLLVTATTFPRWKNDTEPSFVYELSQRLAGKGHDITVLAPHHSGAKRREVMDNLKIQRFRYFWPSSLEKLCYDGGILPNLKRRFWTWLEVPFLMAAEYFAIHRIVKQEGINMIHAHWIVPQGFLASLLKKFHGVKYITTAHAGDIFPLKSPWLRGFAGSAISNADACTANSQFTKKAVLGLSPDSHVDVIPMGVDLSIFSGRLKQDIRQKYGITGKLILSVGRLAEKKGIRHLISAMPSILKKYKDAKLLIVGDGPEKGRLESQVAELSLKHNVIFSGRVSNRDIASYYSSADVFVLPSIVTASGDTEGLGVVLLEALASGTPVVASNVGGVTDIIINGKTGLTVEQENPEVLASAIMRMLKNRKLAKKLARQGKLHVEQNYSWALVADKFNSLILKAMRGKE